MIGHVLGLRKVLPRFGFAFEAMVFAPLRAGPLTRTAPIAIVRLSVVFLTPGARARDAVCFALLCAVVCVSS